MLAVTESIDGNIDLNNVAAGDGYLFVRDGVGFAGRGIAYRIAASQAQTFLSTIVHDNRVPGLTHGNVGPIAMGCLPFIASDQDELIIPQLIVGKDAQGHCWLTRVDCDLDLHISEPTPPTSARFEVETSTPIETYMHAVTVARDAVRQGVITKAVIARAVDVISSEPIDIHAVLLRLRANFGSSYRYSIEGFIGASPELLLQVEDSIVRSHPLAGTTPRTGDPINDDFLATQLLASMKDQIEHRIVIDVIHDMLLPWCSYLDWEPEPSVMKVANVQHLATLIEGRLSDDHPPLIELVRQLSPTPALGGHPRPEALALIAQNEGFNRGRYGGAVGWVDAHGNGTWAVAIRCAQLSDDLRRARLTAGGGIVAESDPHAELAETQAKFQAMLSALIRP